MTSVWKRLQHVGKKAVKFQFVASYQELVLECTKKWQPDTLRVVWTRRNRRVSSELHSWQPDTKNPYRGTVVWPVPENIDILVTLFRDPDANEFEDKDWTFVLEGESKGHRKALASSDINLKQFASHTHTQTDLVLRLKPTSVKVVEATLKLSLLCVFVREGRAIDEDMQSVTSLLSIKPMDISNIYNFDGNGRESVTSHLAHVDKKMSHVSQEITPVINRSNESPYGNTRIANNQPVGVALDSGQTANEGKAKSKYIGRSIRPNIPNEEEKLIEHLDPHTQAPSTSPVTDGEPLEDPDSVLAVSHVIMSDPLAPKPTAVVREDAAKKDEERLVLVSSSRSLLRWCQEVTKGHQGMVMVTTNFRTSWWKGLDFCAILDKLDPQDIKLNSKKVLGYEASGVSHLSAPTDAVLLSVPDQSLAHVALTGRDVDIMAHLGQLRLHFTNRQLRVTVFQIQHSSSSQAIYGFALSGPHPAAIDVATICMTDPHKGASNSLTVSPLGTKRTTTGEWSIMQVPPPKLLNKVFKFRPSPHVLVRRWRRAKQENKGNTQGDEEKAFPTAESTAPESQPPRQPEDNGQYVRDELAALERERERVDGQAVAVERRLRPLMETGSDRDAEEELIQEWLVLVHKKNALMHREDGLELLQREQDLGRRVELLTGELRVITARSCQMSVTQQQQREQLLLQKLASLVDGRDEIVRQIHAREREAAEEDEHLARALERRRRKYRKKRTKCVIQ